jgi:hypothetical protein
MEMCVSLLHALQNPSHGHQYPELLLRVVQVREVLRQKVWRTPQFIQITSELRKMLTTSRHPKIIEDEKAIEVVLRLEETQRPKTGTDDRGRRFTVTAVGSRLGSDHRRISVAAAGIAAGNSVAIPPATQQRKDSEASRSSGASSETMDGEDGNLVVPARTITIVTPQFTPHLQAIEEGRRGSGYF